jgi:hypothetical protein
MKRFMPRAGVFRSHKNIAILIAVLCILSGGSTLAFHWINNPSDSELQKSQSNQPQQEKTNKTNSDDGRAEVKSAQTSQPSQAVPQTVVSTTPQTSAVSKPASPKPSGAQPVANPSTPPPANTPPIIASVTIALANPFNTHPEFCGVSGAGYSYNIYFGGGSNVSGAISASWEYQIISGQQITPRLPRTFSSIAVTPTTYRIFDTPPTEAVGVIEQSAYASYRVRLYITGTNPSYSNWIDVPQARSCS